MLRRSDLSIEARGLLALLLTQGDNFSFRAGFFIKIAGCSKTKYYRILNELKDKNFVQIEKQYDDAGKLITGKYIWIINDEPIEESHPEFPISGNSRIEESHRMGDISNTSLKNTNLRDFKKEKIKKEKRNEELNEQFLNLWKSDRFRKSVPSHNRGSKKIIFKYLVKKSEETGMPLNQILEMCMRYYTQSTILEQREENKKAGINEGKYIKLLSTVINQEFYLELDEPVKINSMTEKKKLAIDKYFNGDIFWPNEILGNKEEIDKMEPEVREHFDKRRLEQQIRMKKNNK